MFAPGATSGAVVGASAAQTIGREQIKANTATIAKTKILAIALSLPASIYFQT
jgi:hypothetical protein